MRFEDHISQRQQGLATLLLTTLLLAAALVTVLGSSKNLFFQIKRAQNEVESRKQHWLAEGAIECGWAQFQLTRSVPTAVTDCNSGLGVIPVFSSTVNGYKVSANVGFASLQKEIQVGGHLGYGAMQSSADVYFRSSATFLTPDPGSLGNDGYECVALRYKSRFEFASITNGGVVHEESPYEDSDNSTHIDCAAVAGNNHRTVATANGATGDDFLQDPYITPFESFFGVLETDHDQIRDAGVFEIITATSGNIVENCGSVLKTQIENGNHHLWLEGSCEITQSQYYGLATATQSTSGVTVMIHEGLFSVMGGGGSAPEFKGVLFHFNYDYTPNLSDWASFDADDYINHVPSVFPDDFRTIASYYQHGSFTVSGGQYFDTDDQAVLFYDSLNFRYNKDVIDNSRRSLLIPSWREGSWYAK